MNVNLNITIPDNKVAAFLEFMKTIDYIKVNKEEEISVPKIHQEFVLNRIATAKPKDYISVNEFKKRIKKFTRS